MSSLPLSEIAAKLHSDGECLIWTGYIAGSGYPYKKVKGRMLRLNRAVYQAEVGPIPEGHVIRHTCDNRLCLRPSHLLAGTPQDNSNDMRQRGRTLTGESNHQSKLTESQVVEIRARYAAGGTSYPRLGREYGVSHHVISEVVHRRAWAHV